MLRKLLTILALASVIAVAPHLAIADEDIERGRALAERLCATCHMNPGQGEKAGPSGIPGFKAVANRPAQTAEGIEAWLRSVPPMMPNHHLTHEEIRVLAAFIMSLRDKP